MNLIDDRDGKDILENEPGFKYYFQEKILTSLSIIELPTDIEEYKRPNNK